MQNNSSNKAEGWQQRLGDFEDIAGNNLDAAEAWEKLQQKEVIQPASKKIWYWLAAASIAGLLFVTVNSVNNPQVQVKPSETVNINKPSPTIETNTALIENAPLTKAEIEFQPAVLKKGKPSSAAIEKIKNDPEVLLVKQYEDRRAQLLQSIDTSAKLAAPVIAVAKKLKVVHINELNSSGNGIVKDEGKPYFPITYQTKQVYTNAAEKKAKDNLIRIKLN